jgi:hypothetical protein
MVLAAQRHPVVGNLGQVGGKLKKREMLIIVFGNMKKNL